MACDRKDAGFRHRGLGAHLRGQGPGLDRCGMGKGKSWGCYGPRCPAIKMTYAGLVEAKTRQVKRFTEQ